MKQLSSLLAALFVCSPFSVALAQAPMPSPAEIHRCLSSLEAELVGILDRKEEIITTSEQRNTELHQLSLDRARAEAKERDRLAARIEVLNNQARAASVELSRLTFTSESIRLEIDRLMRFDDHAQSGGKGSGRAPAIRAVNVVKTDRKGPVRVQGQGIGFQETTIYEVVFADGSRQRVESTSFLPQKK